MYCYDIGMFNHYSLLVHKTSNNAVYRLLLLYSSIGVSEFVTTSAHNRANCRGFHRRMHLLVRQGFTEQYVYII